MAKVLYHQEAGDIEMDARPDTYTDPTNPEAGPEPSVTLSIKGKKIVTRAVEGEKIGQYSLIDPDDAKTLKLEKWATSPDTKPEAAGSDELTRLREQLAAAEKAKAEAEARADTAEKAKAAAEQTAAKASPSTTAAQKPVK